jgi:hypothetical protein
MNRFFPGRKGEDDLEALDPMAHPVTPPRPAGAVKVLVGLELEAAEVSARREAAGVEPEEPVATASAAELEPEEPLPERLYRAGAIEALKGKRLQLTPSQRAAQRAAAKELKKDL